MTAKYTNPRPALLAYDGSADADYAIRTAAQFLHGSAVVAHVYATPTPAAALPAPGIALAADPAFTAEADERVRELAMSVVRQGVEVARAAGFDPVPALVPGDGMRSVWHAIVDVAERYDASVIVLGHGHLSWFAEKLLGRVDTSVIKHAGRPVLVVPCPDDEAAGAAA